MGFKESYRKKCEHGRERSRCIECGGSGLCEHGRERRRCKECGGSGLCKHGRQRSRCKDCGGSSGRCAHGRQASRCTDCGGSGFCEHGRQRYYCKECGGSSFCEHGRRHSRCKDCSGSEHKSYCRCSLCKERAKAPPVRAQAAALLLQGLGGGSSLCEHGRQRSSCKDCGGDDPEATEVEECDGEEDPDELPPTVQARVVGGPRGGKRKR